MVHVAIITALVSAAVCLGLTSSAAADQATGSFRFYEHPGTLGDFRRMRTPDLGAAHAISLASELGTAISISDREDIRRLGPWLTDDGLSLNAQSLIRAIQDSRVHGLDPEAYQLATIVSTIDLLAHLDQPQSGESQEQESERADTENSLRLKLNQLLDSNFIKLAEHLGQGVVNGRSLQSRLYRDAPRIDAFNLLVSISSADLSVGRALRSVSQSHPEYVRLTRKLRNLLTEQSIGLSRTQVASNNGAAPISQAADKQRLRERLLETGDLTFEAYNAPNPDAELLKALRSFQARHGIGQSSFADKQTRVALNRTVADDIEAVVLSLERWRWLPRDLGERHVYVNIPDYRVKLVNKGETELSMAAVVGKFKHQTPSFTRDMSYMEFNPTWTVPATITNKELIPKERRTPGYLVSRDFDFLKRINGHLIRVPASSVTREDFDLANFPYVLQQRGGPTNALGRMKFMMPNQYAIYLHDTQAKKHFTLNDRAYSHGCIRLSDPDALAKALMLGDGYAQSKIDKSMSSKKTHRIRFREPVPTHLVYLTTWVDEQGSLQHRPDIYRNDASLLDALMNTETLLSASANSTL